ncbi:GNAT family N-acetyltransferase [Pseudonocardia broussonetiae]|uniref:GNAT family N-acetyltransferase n=1 Tax=Pseudonocardia broussonetiae TaxID=2736640 RepID=A0A6M6JQV9_9PSEU|nr:GNAT family N-acetyltransferase [Pseudonocardia broussonetiae]QJY48671.1 GNAT family N-acetyltransferase [Pseudonocardia broussonetiae]
MDRDALRRAYDEQVRRGGRSGAVVREDSPTWAGVAWSDLDEDTVDAAVAEQVRHFAGRAWEWKHYSYDAPADLPARLAAAGLVAGEPETVLVADLRAVRLDAPAPPGIELREVDGAADAADLVAVHDAVFGGDHSAIGRELLASVTTVGVVARAGGVPVAAGRVELGPGPDFAGLWGGGTLPEWRGRGLFRALVAHRAQRAAARGHRFLQVDATAASAPILRRLGFVELAVTTPFTLALSAPPTPPTG